MNKAIIVFAIAVFTFLSTETYSQNKNKIPCATPVYKQFDFWIGNWNVYNAKNNLIGKNKVVKMNNACAIQENWSSETSPSKGTSYNYYNATDKSWNQIWIDNAGGSLVLKGFYKNNKMVLKSKLIRGKKGEYYNQITWFKNSDGSVTQLWELLDINNTSFNEIFRGTYKKIIK
jgi:hypothetical protein